ncbi:MAG: hypothetical protein ACI4HO_00755 [Ruminococcus sp.]
MYFFSRQFFNDLTNFLYIILYIFLAIVGIIVLIVIGMIIYNYVAEEKSKKEFINYKKNIPNKYRRLSANAKQDIYNQLVRYRQLEKEVAMYNAHRNTADYTREEIMKMGVKELVFHEMRCDLPETLRKYGVSVNFQYMDNDINYLKQVVNKS